MATMMAIGAVVSSRILARRGARLPMLAAGVGLAVGGVLLSRLTVSTGLAPLAVAFIVFGIGAGVVNAPITYTAVSGMPVSQAGVASGIASTSRQIGQSLGVAITGSILAGNLQGSSLRTGFVPASHAAWLLLAACGIVVFVLGLVTTGEWALGTAARTAATFEGAEPKTAVMTHPLTQASQPESVRGSLRGDLPQGP
jgi:MFS family permease